MPRCHPRRKAQRAFLARAVHFLVTQAGIRHFLDACPLDTPGKACCTPSAFGRFSEARVIRVRS